MAGRSGTLRGFFARARAGGLPDLAFRIAVAFALLLSTAVLGLTPADIVQTLQGCGAGWKHMPITRAELLDGKLHGVL